MECGDRRNPKALHPPGRDDLAKRTCAVLAHQVADVRYLQCVDARKVRTVKESCSLVDPEQAEFTECRASVKQVLMRGQEHIERQADHLRYAAAEHRTERRVLGDVGDRSEPFRIVLREELGFALAQL